MELSTEHERAVDRAYAQNRVLGANLSILLRLGFVSFSKHQHFRLLLDHLQTHEDFEIITGFEYDSQRSIIWLDSLTESLKEMFRKQV